LRYDLSKQRQFYISSCGFWTAEGNYDSIIKLFERGVGVNHKEFTIFCGQGGLFGEPGAEEYVNAYFENVRKAREEFATGGISKETRELFAQTILPREVHERDVDASWEIEG